MDIEQLILDTVTEVQLVSLYNLAAQEQGYELIKKLNENNINEDLNNWNPWDIISEKINKNHDYYKIVNGNIQSFYSAELIENIELSIMANYLISSYLEDEIENALLSL